MNAGSVFPKIEGETDFAPPPERTLYGRPRNSSYRAAIADVVRKLKARHRLSNEALAEEIGCEEKTIRNAEKEAGNLDVIHLLNIAWRYGEDAISPVRSLYLCTPAEPKTLSDRLDELQADFNQLRKELGA